MFKYYKGGDGYGEGRLCLCIETLAERTHGKAYSVPDNTGPGDINDPLAGDDPLMIFCNG